MTKPTLLIIEDDISLRRVLEFSLEEVGYRVVTAVDGNSGLELFREEQPQLVITDIAMPGLSGMEVLTQIKAARPETLVIVITAFGSVERAVEAMKLGAYDYLTKPFGREQLRLTVAKALEFRDLREENSRLREELSTRVDFSSIVGVSAKMKQVFEVVRRVAASEATVLLLGESGTGKELVARAIHQGSERAAGPFVAVNCAAIPRELLESELFGHLKGTFTGALRDRLGKFQQAQGGTLFLDEIAELPVELQPKLLRALQERAVAPVGGSEQRVDVRLVAATNRNLQQAVAEGRFREDLYYRLAVVPVLLPALRQRREDIPLLVRHFLRKYGAAHLELGEALLERMSAHDWPGNVRELENCVERMIILRRGERLDIDDFALEGASLPAAPAAAVLNLPEDGYALEELEKLAVLEALRRCQGNQTKAAQFLRIPRHTLIYRLEKYGIARNDWE